MDRTVSRREVIAAGSAVAALSLAGCGYVGREPGAAGDGTPADGEDGGNRVTVIADVDESELQAAREDARTAQREAQEGFQNGELNRSEAQARIDEAQAALQETQAELLAESVGEIESYAGETEGVSLVESDAELGLALLGGESDGLLGVLELDAVQAVLAGEEYESLQDSRGGPGTPN